VFESVVFNALLRPEFQGVALSELPFVKLGKRGRLAATYDLRPAKYVKESWCASTPFRATAVLRKATDKATPEFLASAAAEGVVYSPETVARMDGVVMQGGGTALTLGITMWTERVPGAKMRSQILSTSMGNAYKNTTATAVNKNCTAVRSEWERLGLDKVKAVRVHVSLPGFSADDMGLDQFDDDVVVHLDRTNIHHLLGPDRHGLYQLLAVATQTKRGEWGGEA
jgi:hypothetical protein